MVLSIYQKENMSANFNARLDLIYRCSTSFNIPYPTKLNPRLTTHPFNDLVNFPQTCPLLYAVTLTFVRRWIYADPSRT